MSVIARCAATPSTCELANEVAVSTSVAAPAAIASFGSRSQLPLVITSSIRYLDVVGSTSPARRLITISPRPSASRLRCFQMRRLGLLERPGGHFLLLGPRARRAARQRPWRRPRTAGPFRAPQSFDLHALRCHHVRKSVIILHAMVHHPC